MTEYQKRLFAFTHPASFGVYNGRLVLRRDIFVMSELESPISIDLAALRGEMVTIWQR